MSGFCQPSMTLCRWLWLLLLSVISLTACQQPRSSDPAPQTAAKSPAAKSPAATGAAPAREISTHQQGHGINNDQVSSQGLPELTGSASKGKAGVMSHDKVDGSCAKLSQSDCLNSHMCILTQNQAKAYVCRSAKNHCEAGFIQGASKAKASCLAKKCQFKPASCYCPTGVQCICGGGMPAQCVLLAVD